MDKAGKRERVIKAPKVFTKDLGLLCYLRSESAGSFLKNRSSAGSVLENFVVMEIIKQLSWSDTMTPEEYVKKYLKKPEISNLRGTALG